LILPDRQKRVLRNVLLAGAVAFASDGYLNLADVTHWRTLTKQADKSAELCRPQLAECRILEQEKERRRPNVPRAPQERPPKNPCPPMDLGIPMQRPCPEPSK
jgi:hypothetical protein